MGVPGAFHMGLGQGARPVASVGRAGSRQAVRSGTRPCSFAPHGGSVAWRKGGGSGLQGWKALESHFPSAG